MMNDKFQKKTTRQISADNHSVDEVLEGFLDFIDENACTEQELKTIELSFGQKLIFGEMETEASELSPQIRKPKTRNNNSAPRIVE